MIKLYHGSYLNIDQIDLNKSFKGKDFGKGFYVSAEKRQAENIARIRATALKKEPILNIYEFDESILDGSLLKIKKFDSYTKEWAEFVLANRNNKSDIPIHDYDIVIGPIANDRVGQQIRRFTDGEITMEEFIIRLQYMKGITIQYFFGTPRAIQHLKKVSICQL